MTEADWLACADPQKMLAFVSRMGGPAVPRKERLFACACARRVWDLLDHRCRQAVIASEQYADGLIGGIEIEQGWLLAKEAVEAADRHLESLGDPDDGPGNARIYAGEAAYRAARGNVERAARAAALAREWSCEPIEVEWHAQCALLRDVFGGYFYSKPPEPEVAVTSELLDWVRTHREGRPKHSAPPPTLRAPRTFGHSEIQLADALYNGEDCCFALHDALLEAGLPDLAEHFRDTVERHVKGCWVLDLLTGRE